MNFVEAASHMPRRYILYAGLAAVLIALLYSIWPTAKVGEATAPGGPVTASFGATPAPPPPSPRTTSLPPNAPEISTLRLFGLAGSGAVLAIGDGAQRLVPIGREVVPGLKVARIEQHFVVLASAGGEVRLGFDGVAAMPAIAAGTAVAALPASPPSDDARAYRYALVPRGKAAGFTLRPGASLPALERIGVRPGDTILKVNGSSLDEERMLELPWQMANSDRIDMEIERGGRHMRLTRGRDVTS